MAEIQGYLSLRSPHFEHASTGARDSDQEVVHKTGALQQDRPTGYHTVRVA